MSLAFWQPNTTYSAGNRVLDNNGNIQQSVAYGSPPVTSGTSGATPPAWSQTLDAVTIDNNVHWELIGYRTIQIAVKPLGPVSQTPLDAVSISQGPSDAGKVALLNSSGTLDPSMGGGGGGGSSFSAVTTGTNTGQTLTVGNLSILSYGAGGVINANEVGTINVAGNAPVHPGQILISQPGNTTALWADPFVQGPYAPNTNVNTGGISGGPINPVLIGGEDPSDLLQNLSVSYFGSPAETALNVFVANTLTVTGTVAVSNFPVSQVVTLASTTITGTVAVTQSGTWTVQQGTPPWVFAGNKTENISVPSTDFVATLPALANTGAPSWTDGKLVPLSVDTAGNLRVTTTGSGGSTQYAEGTTIVTATGTVALGKDATNVVHALKLDGSGNLDVNLQSAVFSSANNSALPANAAWIGASDGTNLQGLRVTDSTNKELRVAIYQGGNEVNVSSNRLAVDGAGGTFPVTGTVSITANSSVNVNQWGGVGTTLGQKVSASSVPVVIASDQSRINTSDQADGSTGAAVPAKAIYVAGIGADNNLHGLSTDNSGVLNVNATFSGTVNPGFVADRIQTGSISNTGGSNQSVSVSTLGAASVVFNIANGGSPPAAWSATLTFQVQLPDNSWVSATAFPMFTGGASVTQTTTNGQWQLPVGGCQAFRVFTAGAPGSGTAAIAIEAGAGALLLDVAQATASNLNATVVQGNAGSIAQSWFTKVTDGTNVLGVAAHPFATQDLSDGVPNTASQPTEAMQVAGWDGTNLRVLSTTSNGFLNVNAAISGSFTPALTADRIVTGSITTTGTVVISAQGTGTILFNIQNGGSPPAGWSGTIQFEASVDGTNWVPAKVVPRFPTGDLVSSATANGQWAVATGGLNSFRLRGASVTVGTAFITLEGGAGAQDIQVISTDANNFNAKIQITDAGGDGPAAVKPASTLPVTTDPALVVSLSPNSTQFATSTTANALPGVNPVTVGTGSVAILNSNANRKEAIVINTGTTIIYLGLGANPSTTAYHIALAKCTVANDGTGGTWTSDMWKGTINAIGSAGGGTVVVTELT